MTQGQNINQVLSHCLQDLYLLNHLDNLRDCISSTNEAIADLTFFILCNAQPNCTGNSLGSALLHATKYFSGSLKLFLNSLATASCLASDTSNLFAMFLRKPTNASFFAATSALLKPLLICASLILAAPPPHPTPQTAVSIATMRKLCC